MIWLAAAIISSGLLFIIFRLFKKWNIHTFQAIVINYAVACGLGIVYNPNKQAVELSVVFSAAWLPAAIILGSMFIGVFYLMALSSQRAGLSVTSVATKMSLVIPLLAGIFLYDETLSATQWAGVVIAIPAILLTMYTGEKTVLQKIYLPVSIFIFSGIIDTVVAYSQNQLVPSSDFAIFSALLFFIAASWGIIFYLIFIRSKIEFKNIAGGILLGIPNFFSIYCLLQAMQTQTLSTGATVAANNIGVVAFSALAGIFFMGEKSGIKNLAGILLAIASIALISFK
jgi:drug/metabolite transporter (DMT)-like permease